MSTQVILNEASFPADVFDEILDYIWTGREDEEEYNFLFPTHYLDESEARLCLPRLFGTIYLYRIRNLGMLWKAIQSNPKLGSYVHTLTFKFSLRLWPSVVIPSEGMERLFINRTREYWKQEVEKRKPGGWKSFGLYSKHYTSNGPDGEGSDPNITSPDELKRALFEIFQQISALQALHWHTELVPLFAFIIKRLEALGSLRRLSVNPAACEEDYFTESSPLEGKLHPPTPIWLLSERLSHLQILEFGPGLRDFPGILPQEEQKEEGPIFERTTETMIKTLDSALNIKVLDLKSLFYLGKDEQCPEILLSILPALSCVPNILVDYDITSWERWSEWGPPIQALYAELRSIQEDEGSLGAEQVHKLGELAATVEDHPLRRLSGFLKREEMAKEITQRWNRRYG